MLFLKYEVRRKSIHCDVTSSLSPSAAYLISHCSSPYILYSNSIFFRWSTVLLPPGFVNALCPPTSPSQIWLFSLQFFHTLNNVLWEAFLDPFSWFSIVNGTSSIIAVITPCYKFTLTCCPSQKTVSLARAQTVAPGTMTRM